MLNATAFLQLALHAASMGSTNGSRAPSLIKLLRDRGAQRAANEDRLTPCPSARFLEHAPRHRVEEEPKMFGGQRTGADSVSARPFASPLPPPSLRIATQLAMHPVGPHILLPQLPSDPSPSARPFLLHCCHHLGAQWKVYASIRPHSATPKLVLTYSFTTASTNASTSGFPPLAPRTTPIAIFG